MQKCNKSLKTAVLLFLAVLILSLSVSAGESVYIGGFPFGVKMKTDGVLVTELGDVDSNVGRVCPARDAGIKVGDIIVSVNGRRADDSQAVADAVSGSAGKRLRVDIMRGSKALSVNLIPVKTSDSGVYKTGLFIKDSASGIGTVTFVKEDGSSFGGLGHGITDRATQTVLPLKNGSVHKAVINGVVKGASNIPGELKGSLEAEPSGVLYKNTDMGVFGKFDEPLSGLTSYEVAEKGEIKEGSCTLYSCLGGSAPQKIEGKISKIVDKNSNTKNFIVSLTDKSILAQSGGIVQGMSGSPIIQNGKLVGALTHVLMSDQKSGYGIFIENMLNEANKIK